MEDSTGTTKNSNRLAMTGIMTRQKIENGQHNDGNLVVDLGDLFDKDNAAQQQFRVDTDNNDVEVGGGDVIDEPEPPVLFQVILLVINPTASDESSIFELLRVQVFNIETAVEDLLDQIPRLATKKAIRRQTYRRGVIGNPMTMKATTGYLLFPKSVLVYKLLSGGPSSPSSLSSGSSSQEPSPRSSIQQSQEKTVVLIPLPEEVTVSECAEEACTILQDPSVCKLLTTAGVDTTKWECHPPNDKEDQHASVVPSRPQHPSETTSPLTPRPTISPAIFYCQIAGDIFLSMVAQQHDETPYAPLLISLACQSAVSYYYLSRATQAILANGAGANKINFKRAMSRKGGGMQKIHNPAMDWLESIYSKYRTTGSEQSLSYADLYILAGVVAVHSMGGPTIPWKHGRSDSLDQSNTTQISPSKIDNDHREEKKENCSSPSTSKRHFGSVFEELDFNPQEIVALSGANAFVRCHPIVSSSDGTTTTAIPAHNFRNTFFVLLDKLSTSPSSSVWKNGPFPYCMKDDDMRCQIDLVSSDVELLDPEGPYYQYVRLYAQNEKRYFIDFSHAFFKLMHIGTNNLSSPVTWWASIPTKKSSLPSAAASSAAASLSSKSTTKKKRKKKKKSKH